MQSSYLSNGQIFPVQSVRVLVHYEHWLHEESIYLHGKRMSPVLPVNGTLRNTVICYCITKYFLHVMSEKMVRRDTIPFVLRYSTNFSNFAFLYKIVFTPRGHLVSNAMNI